MLFLVVLDSVAVVPFKFAKSRRVYIQEQKMDSPTDSAPGCCTAFGKSLCVCQSGVMIFTTLVICFFFSVQVESTREKVQWCSYLCLVFLFVFSSSWGSAGNCFLHFLCSELHSSDTVLH